MNTKSSKSRLATEAELSLVQGGEWTFSGFDMCLYENCYGQWVRSKDPAYNEAFLKFLRDEMKCSEDWIQGGFAK
ncbi:MAG: hypothetical protein K0S11_1307 [Gammaproteobacteria bacterium]|jgi:hypothetical protein|nr:hypothetical protein [Gammaproteobacteria bacterium]